jgi:1-phosphatidylinositol-3-phosphate 5-kinase
MFIFASAGGSKTDCRIVNGIVFTKNIAHKNMSREMKNPKILLLRSSIEYQRVEEKLCSLQPLLIAESQYLRNNCSKLLRLNPDILVVEKNVARYATDYGLE